MSRVVVTVMPRAGVLDPQGQAVQGALGRLGFDGAEDVRVGRRIELTVAGPDPEGQARRMCEELLANPLIEDYTVTVEG
jgi:phosphoribosylformylglycinamidine synthase